MKITLSKAHELLNDCAAVILDHTVTYPALEDLTGERDNIFLRASWTDSDFQDYELKFEEGMNKEVEIVGTSMFLMDTTGEVQQISLLKNWDIESEIL